MAVRNLKGGGKGQDKIWSDAVRRAVKRARDGKGRKKLEILADSLVDKGINGDVSAMREVGDRLDGRSTQAVNLKHDVTDKFAEILKHVHEHNTGFGPKPME